MARRRSSLSTVCGMPLPLQQGRMLAAVFLFITNRFVCPLERGERGQLDSDRSLLSRRASHCLLTRRRYGVCILAPLRG